MYQGMVTVPSAVMLSTVNCLLALENSHVDDGEVIISLARCVAACSSSTRTCVTRCEP